MMIYHKLDGTTSSKFKIGKGGPVLDSLSIMTRVGNENVTKSKFRISESDGTQRILGLHDARYDPLKASDPALFANSIPTMSALIKEQDRKITTISTTVDMSGLSSYDYVFLEK